MREFIKQMFVVLVLMLYFCRPLTRKCVSINNQRCMVRPMFIDLNLDELHYYQFIINMNRCKGSCNIAEDEAVILLKIHLVVYVFLIKLKT